MKTKRGSVEKNLPFTKAMGAALVKIAQGWVFRESNGFGCRRVYFLYNHRTKESVSSYKSILDGLLDRGMITLTERKPQRHDDYTITDYGHRVASGLLEEDGK